MNGFIFHSLKSSRLGFNGIGRLARDSLLASKCDALDFFLKLSRALLNFKYGPGILNFFKDFISFLSSFLNLSIDT